MNKEMNKWIPTSERLPKPEGHTEYLVTVAHFDPTCTGRHVMVSEYEARDSEIAPYWTNDVNGGVSRVVAWMPLPKPYREGEA